jgi:AcrR family transcriptional regulator
MTTPTDRAAAVRAAVRTLVARNGFHGASMNAVAREAGVATGTAYTHYVSKDELVVAAYREAKAGLTRAITAGQNPDAAPRERFVAMWRACYEYLGANVEDARFLLQVEDSPYRAVAHQAALADAGDPLVAQVARPDLAARLLPLPLEVLYELAFGPAVRLAAAGSELTAGQLDLVADACWRAVSRPDADHRADGAHGAHGAHGAR